MSGLVFERVNVGDVLYLVRREQDQNGRGFDDVRELVVLEINTVRRKIRVRVAGSPRTEWWASSMLAGCRRRKPKPSW